MPSSDSIDRLCIEHLSVFGLHPMAYIQCAVRMGIRQIGLAPAPVVADFDGTPPWTLRGNRALESDVAQALADNDIRLSLGEGFLIRPGADILAQADDMDLLARLGVPRVNICSIESDHSRNIDQFAQFTQMAKNRGLTALIEFLPATAVGDITAACALLAAAGQGHAGLMLDAMHFFRSGGTITALQSLDPALIAYAQLCDVPRDGGAQSYADEARYNRLCPGDGALPLAEFLAALPINCPIGLEIPMRDKAVAKVNAEARLRPAIEAACRLLDKAKD